MTIQPSQQENENSLMEAPCPHGALRYTARDEDIPPPSPLFSMVKSIFIA
jgi:hypothetical protein